MRIARLSIVALACSSLLACARTDRAPAEPQDAPAASTDPHGESEPAPEETAKTDDFEHFTEQFGDVRVLRYQVPGFDELSVQQKKLVYYLSQAALSGRDIIWDQNYRHNLAVRRTLEAIAGSYAGDRKAGSFEQFEIYAKRVWFSNGIHHHYSMKKLLPEFDQAYFGELVRNSDTGRLPLRDGESVDAFITRMTPIVFDPKLDAKRVNLDPEADLIASSATNYYGPKVTQKDVERFYRKKTDKKDPTPVSWGLNSQLVKGKGGKLQERVWKVGGMYDPAISQIVHWLGKAVEVAESDAQRKALELLISYYETGDLKKFDEYSVAWVADTESRVDVVNGFIEVYGDPMGYRGAYESVVSFKDLEATKRIDAVSKQAQWFEDHSPIAKAFKKESVKGISAKVITVVTEAGDAAPSTPIGINLPNSNWIRAEHGSKSVNLGNIVHAYDQSSKTSGVLEEFAVSKDEVERSKRWGDLGDKLHTDMHEVIGHASGKLAPGVGTPKETLKNYSSTLEEARADLVALYYLMDPKLVEIGVMDDLEVGKAAYDDYIRNGLLVQLARLELGEDLEEAHMRNRQMIAKWVFEKGEPQGVVEKKTVDGKTYFVVRDYEKLRGLFGQLLAEVQRIKSKGDYAAGKALVETYGVKVDPDVHREVKRRYEALNIAPYAGFIQPRLIPVEEGGEIVDVKIEYPRDFKAQMLEYGEAFSLLPTYPE